MKICYRSFFVYLAIDGVKNGASRAGIKWLDNIGGSKSLSKSSNGEINLEKVELGKFNAKLEP